jgi:para-nitrobenzyl esterase
MTKQPNTVVETESGKLNGSYEGGLFVFKGIPYAEPPVGDLRWLPSKVHKPWSGIREAKEFGSIAPQPPTSLQMIHEFEVPEPQSEDCLFLNVWTPILEREARLPVMVWIHGGAFSMGSGSQPMYQGGKLASRGNLVLVTLNYRLGMLGFLNLKELTGGKIPATGNEGLLDQVAALEWVRDNISAFGGDPKNVTIFGESAGAMSIGCLLAMPTAQGIFQRAIMESAVGEMARPLQASVKVAETFLRIAGLQGENVKSLRSLTTRELLSIHTDLAMTTGGGLAPAIPVADGIIMPRMPLEAIKDGSAKNIPVIVGSNLDEWKLFAAVAPNPEVKDEDALTKRLQRLVPEKHIPSLIETYKKALTKRGSPVNPTEIWSAVQSDMMFRLTALSVVTSQCANNQAAYNYVFTWKSPAMNGKLGACHALEIGFLYGTYDNMFCGTGPEVEKLARKMQDAWTAFARSGNPSCEGLGEWPQYCKNKKTMIIGKDSHVEEAPYEDERRIWETIGKTDFDMP